MVHSGATAATMSTSSHPHFDHDDALGLAEYGLAPANSNALGTSPNNLMGGFPDFDLAFAHTQNPGYPGSQVHRGSVGGVSDDNMSGGASVHPRPLSIGGSPGMLTHEGHHTSPESAPAMGMLSMNDQRNSSAQGLKLEAKDGSAFGSSTTGKRAKDIEQDTPQWTEMKTKAGKERKRLPCMYRLSKKEDPLLGREASLQALCQEQNTVCVQGHNAKSCAENRLHGHAGQAIEAHGRSRHQAHPKGELAFGGKCRKIGREACNTRRATKDPSYQETTGRRIVQR